MRVARLKDTSIRDKLLLLVAAASLAFLAVSLSFALGWRAQQQVSSRVSTTYIPVLRDSSAVMLNIASVSRELFRYVNHIEPSPYRIRDSLEGVRGALQRIESREVPGEIRGNIRGLLRMIATYEMDLARLVVGVEADDAVGVSDVHARMGAEANFILGAVERIHGQLWDSIVSENAASAQQASHRAGLAVALGFACVIGALFYMLRIRGDLEGGLLTLRDSVRDYMEGGGGAITPLERRDEIGQLSRFLGQLSAAVRAGEARLREQLKTLRTEQQRLALVVRATRAGIIDWDSEHDAVWHSERLKELLGYSPDADTSQWNDVLALIHPEDEPPVREIFLKRLKEKGDPGGESLYGPTEFRLKRADGTYVWVEAVGLYIRDATGRRAARFLSAMTDISARRAQEQALRDQVSLTRDLIDGNPNPTYLKDEEGRFIEINDAYMRQTGMNREQVVGRRVLELYPVERAAQYDRQDRDLLARGEGSSAIEVDVLRDDGRRQYYLMSKSIVRRADGSVRGLVGTLTEITRLKEAEQALRESEERVRFWLANLPIPIVIYDPEGRVQYLNPAFAATFGWELEEVRGGRMPFVPEDRAQELSGVLVQLRTVGRADFETQRLTREGRLLDIYISTGMARAADGTARSTMVSLMDVTGRKRMERELAASREEALQAAQAKSAFLAAMSHEIRTPLNGVLGMAGLLAGTGLDAEQRDYVETIRVSGDALLSVINDILDYSKIESGRMELENQPFEPVRAVEESLEILGESARSKHLELLAEVDDSVPGWARGDFARLRQVLVNLVGNAVKFTERGEVVVRVGSAADGSLAFAVRDTGIGIARDRLKTLFEPFTQADVSTTRRYGGTGLGLAISRRLVEFMGGSLRAESEPGRGSIFSFEVKATRCAAPADRPPVPRAADLAGRRVLIVDDNATNLRILRRQLEGWGALPVAAAGAAAALDLLSRGETFDLALLDYHMPGMDGVMLARRIKERAAQLPLVLLSSSMYRHAEEAEKGLFVEQLLKPVRQQHLRDAIDTALTGSKSPAPARRSRIGRVPGQPSLRVLVVDDVEVNRRVARALLRELGHECVEATGGLEAVEIAAGGGFDTILMDLQMPDIDGLAATRCIRERLGERAPRIVGMTANAMPGDRERCLEAGMDGYLSKPIDPAAFAAELGSVTPPVAASAAQEDSTRSAAPADQLVDRARIRLLLEYDDEHQTMVKSLIDTFLRDAPRYLEAIREAHARGDRAQVAHHAHALKGAASNAAACALSEVVSRLEALALDGKADSAAQLVATLPEIYGRTAAALNEERERLGK